MLGGAGFLPSTAGFLNHQQESCEARIQSPLYQARDFSLAQVSQMILAGLFS